ncbi:alpha/beta hydrolase [Salinarimonas sp.]|uniref:alpha/beta fold hydrolase n=1 Tax=Salinarimonas sp. TaxID=2766526 RepID=UPI0032D8FEFB
MADIDPPRFTEAALGPVALGALAIAAGGAALYAFVHGRRVERERHPPHGRTVRVDGVRIHYVEVGPADAPPILFVHGNGACLDDMLLSGLVGACAGRYRCIVPDRPGYGHSSRPRGRSYAPEDQAELMSAFLREIGVEAPLVVGHSWGTLVALAMALDPRALVCGAVLMSGYYYPQDRSDIFVMGLPATPVIGPALLWTLGLPTMRRMAPRLLGHMFDPLPVPERVLADYPFAYGERPSQMRAAAAELAVMRDAATDLTARYASCVVPVSLLHGAEDKAMAPALHTQRLAAELPGARVALLPGLGHMIHYFAQDAIVAAIDETMGRACRPAASSPEVVAPRAAE